MEPQELIQSIRDILASNLSVKTNWGRNQVMLEFEKAVTSSLLKLSKKEG